MIEKITLEKDPQKLERDLDRYIQVALENGATAATAMPAENIVLDERVQMKCRFPLCEVYGALDRQRVSTIVSRVESAAFYDGHYFATGFGGGTCRWRMCGGQPCQALQGQGCRHKARAHASMESVGMDVFAIATLLGWDIYPIGKHAQAEMIPHGTRVGLILIA